MLYVLPYSNVLLPRTRISLRVVLGSTAILRVVIEGASVDKMPGDKHDCNYLAHALSIVVVGASGDLAKKKVNPNHFVRDLPRSCDGYIPVRATRSVALMRG